MLSFYVLANHSKFIPLILIGYPLAFEHSLILTLIPGDRQAIPVFQIQNLRLTDVACKRLQPGLSTSVPTL